MDKENQIDFTLKSHIYQTIKYCLDNAIETELLTETLTIEIDDEFFNFKTFKAASYLPEPYYKVSVYGKEYYVFEAD